MSFIVNEKLKALIVKFSEFLNASSELIVEFDKHDNIEYFLNNWLQANWEMIVEHFVSQESGKLILLKKYGEGADDLFKSLLKSQTYYQRVSLPSMSPTHKIMCRPLKNDLKCISSHELIVFPPEGLEFRELVSTNDEGEYLKFTPPFNKVLISEPENHEDIDYYPLESIVLIDNLNFTLVETVPGMDY